MKNFKLLLIGFAFIASTSHASLEAKCWPASDKAKQFVKDTVVVGMLASPYGTGWTKDEQLLTYFSEAREAGIAGHAMTHAAASHNRDELMRQHKAFRSAMAEEPENYIFVRTTRHIEAAHIQGKTAVIWNSQTSTILEEDLCRMAALKDMGIATDDMFDVSLVVAFARKNATMYNDGGYMIDAFNKGADDSAPLARILPAVTDELWKRGYSSEDLAKIYGGNNMRVYQRIWEGVPEGQWDEEYAERVKLRRELLECYQSR